MADIVSSLFGLSPREQYARDRQQEFEMQARTMSGMYDNQYDRQNAYLGSKLGSLIGQGVGNLFGLQDPALKRMSGLEGVLQEAQQELGQDMADPTKLYPALADKLQQRGFGREAAMVTMQGQQAINDWQLQQSQIEQRTSQAEQRRAEIEQNKLGYASRYNALATRFPDMSPGEVEGIARDAQAFREVMKETTQVVETKDGMLLVDKRTGNEIKNIGASPDRGTKVNVDARSTTKAEEEYGKAVGKDTATRDIQRIDNAKLAEKNIGKLRETRNLIMSGDINAGFGSGLQDVVARAKSKLLLDKKAGKNVSDSQYLDSLLGSDVFAQISALGIGARGLDTPAEREFLKEVITGTRTLDKDTLQRMVDFRIAAAERAAQDYNEGLSAGEFTKYEETTGRKLKPVGVSQERAPAAGLEPVKRFNRATGKMERVK